MTKSTGVFLRHLPMPLTSAQTLFDSNAWYHVFNLVARFAAQRGDKQATEKSLQVKVRDLYFSKSFNDGQFDLSTAAEDFARIGVVQIWERNNQDRADESGLTIDLGSDQKFKFYVYKGQGCITVGKAVATDCASPGEWLKITEKPGVTWTLDPKKFLNFIELVDKNLHGRGETIHCRVALDVSFAGAEISVRQFAIDTEYWHMSLRGSKATNNPASLFENSLQIAA